MVVACTLFFYANEFFAEPGQVQKTEKRIEELRYNVQSGKLEPMPEVLIGIVGKAWKQEDEVQQEMAKAHAHIAIASACTIFLAVLLQIYVIFRVKAAQVNRAR